MTRFDLSPKQELLKAIPENGTAIGNTQLMRQLAWGKEKYWAVRDELLNEGLN